MARPREFDPQEALAEAVRLFWRKGYQNTSMADLVQATGVSRYGFYNGFGDKHDLFLKCLDHYSNTRIEQILSPLEKPDASLPEIYTYFEQLVEDADSERPPLGCLIGNSSLANLDWDMPVKIRIVHHFGRMHDAFLNAVKNALKQGQIPPDQDPEITVAYLIGVANGYLACIRTMTPASVKSYLEVSLARLNGG